MALIFRLAAAFCAAAICIAFFTQDWAMIRMPGRMMESVTGFEFFNLGLARTDEAWSINGGVAFVWVILPVIFAGFAFLSAVSGVTSRLFVMMGGLGTIAAVVYVSVFALLSGGQVADGAFVTGGVALGLIVTGFISRALRPEPEPNVTVQQSRPVQQYPSQR